MLRIFFLSLFFSISLQALELDAKFVARILATSDSKRTILVNRGSETGVALGDHTKISLPTSGMVARAVCVRISPARSVWSIYRLFSEDPIEPKTVYTFKITKPVKLTSDESKKIGSVVRNVIQKRKKTDLEKSGVLMPAKNVNFGEGDKTDYQSLNEEKSKKRNESIDWSNLDQASQSTF